MTYINNNNLIRQYVPKGSDVRPLTEQQVLHIMDRLNNRPRKSLAIQHQMKYSINVRN